MRSELESRFQRLGTVTDPGGRIVTLCLDLAHTGMPAPATRIFLKDRVARELRSGDAASERLWDRIEAWVREGVHPESHGAFLVAGPDVWEAIELRVPLPNFFHRGTAPMTGLLLEATLRWPRAYVARLFAEGAILEEISLGARRTLQEVGTFALPDDPQRAKSGLRLQFPSLGRISAGTGIGGPTRDRFHRSEEESRYATIRQAAERLSALEGSAPAEAVFVFGDREYFGVFAEHLSARLRSRAVHAGAPAESEMLDIVLRALDAQYRERTRREILELQNRRTLGYLVALGLADVLAALRLGKAARVFLRADDPVRGAACAACGLLYSDRRQTCPDCGGGGIEVSLHQAIINQVLAHPPMAITFVPRPARWLDEHGGLAALLAPRGVRRTRKRSGRIPR